MRTHAPAPLQSLVHVRARTRSEERTVQALREPRSGALPRRGWKRRAEEPESRTGGAGTRRHPEPAARQPARAQALEDRTSEWLPGLTSALGRTSHKFTSV
ncbi:hypothetical protein OJAV_G00195380 [Oryzias javanicus]|uniref:Uncharacterized protein n=1 Tax=Oryzias javanicus TaxID=123683 RepID=A0A437C7E3_ORYJA|nr:hypothetical protein OJAV_G00195380 [Oryzias javanicus]